MELTKQSENGHIAVFPFPFTSHPLVMFDLVLNLASATPNLHFSFFNTTQCNNSLLSKKNLHLPPNIIFYNLDDGSEEPEASSLFEKMENVAKVVPENFRRGIDKSENQIGLKVTCFLADAIFCNHIRSIAEERNVSWIALWVLAPYSLPAFLPLDDIQKLYENSDKPENLILDIIPGLSPVNYLDIPMRELIEMDPSWREFPINLLFESMIRNIHRASSVIMNSFQELNPVALTDHVKSKFDDTFFLGNLSDVPLSPDGDGTGCMSWLDGQKAESVVYIRTGTTVGWLPEECSALAEALDAFGFPFLWILTDKSKGHLPSGFPDRTKGKFVSWGTQSQILRHPSMGVYVTHCGYNSAMESIAGGVPMICCSVWADNHLTAKMVEEVWEVGVRIEGRKITKEGMMKSLETIFKDRKGTKIRENVNNLKHVLLKAAGPDGVAAQDFKALVKQISN